MDSNKNPRKFLKDMNISSVLICGIVLSPLIKFKIDENRPS